MSLILEGFTSPNAVLITEGFADISELIYTGVGTIIVSGKALSQRILQNYLYSGIGLIDISGIAPISFTRNFIISATGEIILSGAAEGIYTRDFYYVTKDGIEVSGFIIPQLGLSYTPTGEIIISGEFEVELVIGGVYLGTGAVLVNGSAFIDTEGFINYYESSGKVYVIGFSTSELVKFLKYIEIVPEIEAEKNYFDRFVEPEFSPKIKGRTTRIRIVDKEALFASRSKVVGKITPFDKKTKAEYFASKSKTSGKTTHIEGGDSINYFDLLSEK